MNPLIHLISISVVKHLTLSGNTQIHDSLDGDSINLRDSYNLL